MHKKLHNLGKNTKTLIHTDIMITTSNKDNNDLWFALYASYPHMNEVKTLLDCNGIGYFTPMYHITILSDNKEYEKIYPAISDMLFVRSTADKIKQIVSQHNYLGFKLSFANNVLSPIVIPENDMLQLISADKLNDGQVRYTCDNLHCANEERVKIINGTFSGLEGTYINVSGLDKKRVIIATECITAILPAINPKYIEHIQ